MKIKVDAAQVALNYAALRAAADLADHWIQTDHQARCKGWHDGDQVLIEARPGDLEPDVVRVRGNRPGQKACAAHVASYVATQGVALILASAVSGRRLSFGGLTAGLALSGATHYIADRRRPLRWVAERTGKAKFVGLADHGMNGAYLLDQAWHHTFETIAAVVAAIGSHEK